MYSLGIDFGTESGRVLIVDENGVTISTSVVPYRHGVITEHLPSSEGNTLPKDYALQHPEDYLEVLQTGIPEALYKANITNRSISGVGIAFTSSTVLATDKNLTPMCLYKQHEADPHAWVKLWKHHSAQKESMEILNKANNRQEEWLGSFGNQISTEWLLPKCLETFYKSPKLYSNTEFFIEAGDWIVSILTGKVVRSNCSLGFKALWNEKSGFPTEFFKALNLDFGNTMPLKLRGEIKNVGEKAGNITKEMADKTGLLKGTPVAVSIIDAHSSLLGIGASNQNQLTMVMGTSTCHLMSHKQFKYISGISGVVKDAVIPGLFTYEAGQSAVGDLFGWYLGQVPFEYIKEANDSEISIFQLLENKARKLTPGESGLISLDWHNGNRSILSNFDLSGALIGITLNTTPEEIYLSLLEASAFSTKVIFDTYENAELIVEDVFACGGLPLKNELLMQTYADVLNKNIKVSQTTQASGVGASILGAIAGGIYNDINKASQAMKQPFIKTYNPIKDNVIKYKSLFNIYQQIHDYFGRERPDIMKTLKIGK